MALRLRSNSLKFDSRSRTFLSLRKRISRIKNLSMLRYTPNA